VFRGFGGAQKIAKVHGDSSMIAGAVSTSLSISGVLFWQFFSFLDLYIRAVLLRFS